MTLADQFGRVASDLRVSLTDRCNLRCSYCMPEEGLNWLPRADHLTDDELVRVIGLFVAEGVDTVRLTGGEPLLRRGLPGIVARIAALPGRPEISLTTNGIGLDRLAAPLAEAGLDRVNVSLDSADPQVYARLTRRDRFHDVERGLKAAADAGLRPVKVNAVAMQESGDPRELLSWCLDRGYALRFIEQMPLDAGHTWDRAAMLTREELLSTLGRTFSLRPVPQRGTAPAEEFFVDDGPATVGIIASVTAPFCGSCDRVRLTADGQVRNCLFARDEDDLRGPLRAGASDAELIGIVRATMWRKARGHGIGRPDFVQPERPMSSIGG